MALIDYFLFWSCFCSYTAEFPQVSEVQSTLPLAAIIIILHHAYTHLRLTAPCIFSTSHRRCSQQTDRDMQG